MGASTHPRRIAIVGSGPSAMYAVQHLLDQCDVPVEIDIFERLPAPWGLVRYGVAPDHPEKKLVIDRLFAASFHRPDVQFFGNVEIGVHINHTDLKSWYDAVIYATGANSDIPLGLAGETYLSGCHAAREFVAWYNGHPDYTELEFDFSSSRAVIVGNGNVALDIARILTMPVAALAKTDMADYAIKALTSSNIREVVILGRRGPVQGAFNNPELEELGHLPNVDIICEGMAQASNTAEDGVDWTTRRKLITLDAYGKRPTQLNNKRIIFRFLSSPLELAGKDSVEALKVTANHLVEDAKGRLHARPTGETETLKTGLVFRAIGYRNTPFPGLPFNNQQHVVCNQEGRVINGPEIEVGVYVTGWLKRGPKGLIGSNKKCALETVTNLLHDIKENRLPIASATRSDILAAIAVREKAVVNKAGWNKLDHHERLCGRAENRPAVKVTDRTKMLALASYP